MSEWCHNRFEITGKSVCIELLVQWITGKDVPRYRHAIQQSIQLFLAGYAGIIKPISTTSFPACQDLIRHGTGQAMPANSAFEQWLTLLKKNAELNAENIKLIDRLYHQTGLSALQWQNIPDASRGIIAAIITRQYGEWFGLASLSDKPDIQACWEQLRTYPECSQPCDMLMVLPSRLAIELNGDGGLLVGTTMAHEFYKSRYGIEWPAGHNVQWFSNECAGLTLQFDSPWGPPSGEVIAGLSFLYDCEIRHTYHESGSEITGYNCYDQGEHVGGHSGLPASTPRPSAELYLVTDEPATFENEQVNYRGVRG